MWLSDEMKTNYTHTLTAKLTNFFLLSLFNVVLEVLGHDNFYLFFLNETLFKTSNKILPRVLLKNEKRGAE
jgi:hypothetical protein